MSGRAFTFSYGVSFKLVEGIAAEKRLDKYVLPVKSTSNSLHWVQMIFMVLGLVVSTFALKRALDAALNKDTEAMRSSNKRKGKGIERKNYQHVSISDDAIEDAFEERQELV